MAPGILRMRPVKFARFGTLTSGGVQTTRRASNRQTATSRLAHKQKDQIRRQEDQLEKQDGAKHLKHAPELIT